LRKRHPVRAKSCSNVVKGRPKNSCCFEPPLLVLALGVMLRVAGFDALSAMPTASACY